MLHIPGLGWQPDVPDARDYRASSHAVQELLGRLPAPELDTPLEVDLREYFGDVRDQHGIDSASAHACVGLVEYFRRRIDGDLMPLSALFCYQGALKLQRLSGAAPVGIRSAIKSIATFGLPPEHLWPDTPENRTGEQPGYLYAFAREYQTLQYWRLDDSSTSGEQTLNLARQFLAAGFPLAIGFAVPVSISRDPSIPFRPRLDALYGGQSVLAVGYDDRRPGSSPGALLIRNSWGTVWGESGYGWLPYGYVREQMARDFWTLARPEWMDAGVLSRPRPMDPAFAAAR